MCTADVLPDLWPFLTVLFFADDIIGSTTAFQQEFIRLLSFAGLSSRLPAFPCSDNPICTYTHRCLLWACKLDAACNGVWCFIVKAFTPPHLPHNLVGYTFLCSQRLEPLLHRFVSQLRHTHHRYFIDPRHIGCTTHLWAAFHISITPCLGSSLPTSPGFRHQPFGLRLPEYQGGRFRPIPRHSTLWIISSPK